MAVLPASTSPRRTLHLGVLALTILVFGAAVVAITLELRARLREQFLRREAEWLEAVASMQLAEAAEALGGEPIENVPSVLLFAMLKTQKLAGVSGLKVFDSRRQQSGTWMLVKTDDPVPEAIWNELAGGRAIGRLHTQLSPEESADLLLTAPRSMLEAWVPLRASGSDRMIGAAQFWRDGEKVAADLAEHSERLWVRALLAWLGGSLVIVMVLGWALRRLDATNRELQLRSEDLQRANRELVLAAKTSALGAVTAHLMHELKNPLAGLEVIVAGQAEPEAGAAGGELAAASELTRRLRTMVNDIVGVLRDEQSGAAFELTCAEVAEVVRTKVESDAAARGVSLEVAATPDVVLPGRRANLATLVLRNLLQNAIEATPQGRRVKLTASARGDGGAEFLVEDGGTGLPAAVRARLFQPCASSKVGGSGLGLALSHQLAQQAGGKLELLRTGESGTCFRLVLGPEP